MSVVMDSQAVTCSVCNKDIPQWRRLAALSNPSRKIPSGYHSCGNFECNSILEKHQSMTTPQFESYLKFQSERIINTRIAAIEEENRLEQQKEKEHRENNESYQAILRERKLATEHYPLLVLPQCSQPVSHPSVARFEALADSIRNSAVEAVKSDYRATDEEKDNLTKCQTIESSLMHQEEVKKLIISACTLCKGGCCTHGGNHAYLSTITLHRYAKTQGIDAPEELIEAYLSKVPGQSHSDSCIFHTEQGCNLPREMRSDICNGYLCDGLKAACKAFSKNSETEAIGVIAVTRALDNWQKRNHSGNNPITGIYAITVIEDE